MSPVDEDLLLSALGAVVDTHHGQMFDLGWDIPPSLAIVTRGVDDDHVNVGLVVHEFPDYGEPGDDHGVVASLGRFVTDLRDNPELTREWLDDVLEDTPGEVVACMSSYEVYAMMPPDEVTPEEAMAEAARLRGKGLTFADSAWGVEARVTLLVDNIGMVLLRSQSHDGRNYRDSSPAGGELDGAPLRLELSSLLDLITTTTLHP